jgi:hypothetical protein
VALAAVGSEVRAGCKEAVVSATAAISWRIGTEAYIECSPKTPFVINDAICAVALARGKLKP